MSLEYSNTGNNLCHCSLRSVVRINSIVSGKENTMMCRDDYVIDFVVDGTCHESVQLSYN